MRSPVVTGFWSCLFGSFAAAATWFEGERPWITIDGALWDISDDGLPFRMSIVQPATGDPLGSWLRATDQQWTATLGYAQVRGRPVLDARNLRNEGGDSFMAGIGRQWRWRLPEVTAIAGWRPHLNVELGLNYATQSLPADGTHFNFPVIIGFEWQRLGRDGGELDPWIFGVRWFHLSNANVLEGNAGYDGIVWKIGRRWTW
jgi:hypothetical protein